MDASGPKVAHLFSKDLLAVELHQLLQVHNLILQTQWCLQSIQSYSIRACTCIRITPLCTSTGYLLYATSCATDSTDMCTYTTVYGLGLWSLKTNGSPTYVCALTSPFSSPRWKLLPVVVSLSWRLILALELIVPFEGVPQQGPHKLNKKTQDQDKAKELQVNKGNTSHGRHGRQAGTARYWSMSNASFNPLQSPPQNAPHIQYEYHCTHGSQSVEGSLTANVPETAVEVSRIFWANSPLFPVLKVLNCEA